MDYLGRIAALKRLLVLDSVQFSAAGTTGAGPGAATSGAGASTGPFSGASELTVTITARMFETPPGLAAAEAGTGAVTTAASTGRPCAAEQKQQQLSRRLGCTDRL